MGHLAPQFLPCVGLLTQCVNVLISKESTVAFYFCGQMESTLKERNEGGRGRREGRRKDPCHPKTLRDVG